MPAYYIAGHVITDAVDEIPTGLSRRYGLPYRR
jgi:hypothetical protein